jgi:hypothetical protein
MNDQDQITLDTIRKERLSLLKEITIAQAKVAELNIRRQNIIMR